MTEIIDPQIDTNNQDMDEQYGILAEKLLEIGNVYSIHSGIDEHISSSGRLLHYLYNNNGCAMPNEIGTALGVNNSRASVLLNSLEASGLIERTISIMDRRKIFVKITDEGRKSVEEYITKKKEDTVKLLQRLGPEDASEYVRLIKILHSRD